MKITKQSRVALEAKKAAHKHFDEEPETYTTDQVEAFIAGYKARAAFEYPLDKDQETVKELFKDIIVSLGIEREEIDDSLLAEVMREISNRKIRV